MTPSEVLARLMYTKNESRLGYSLTSYVQFEVQLAHSFSERLWDPFDQPQNPQRIEQQLFVFSIG
jgi:hypothetical protein